MISVSKDGGATWQIQLQTLTGSGLTVSAIQDPVNESSWPSEGAPEPRKMVGRQIACLQSCGTRFSEQLESAGSPDPRRVGDPGSKRHAGPELARDHWPGSTAPGLGPEGRRRVRRPAEHGPDPGDKSKLDRGQWPSETSGDGKVVARQDRRATGPQIACGGGTWAGRDGLMSRGREEWGRAGLDDWAHRTPGCCGGFPVRRRAGSR
jgi:hypothetical protein